MSIFYVKVSKWHIARRPETEMADHHGPVYLTKCWRWIDASQALHKGAGYDGPSSNDDLCQTCLREMSVTHAG
ncbi:hypothetical protein BH23CHL7_BH23CHL7_16060 [soil metagenome]